MSSPRKQNAGISFFQHESHGSLLLQRSQFWWYQENESPSDTSESPIWFIKHVPDQFQKQSLTSTTAAAPQRHKGLLTAIFEKRHSTACTCFVLEYSLASPVQSSSGRKPFPRLTLSSGALLRMARRWNPGGVGEEGGRGSWGPPVQTADEEDGFGSMAMRVCAGDEL